MTFVASIFKNVSVGFPQWRALELFLDLKRHLLKDSQKADIKRQESLGLLDLTKSLSKKTVVDHNEIHKTHKLLKATIIMSFDLCNLIYVLLYSKVSYGFPRACWRSLRCPYVT